MLVVGSINADVYLNVSKVPVLGETIAAKNQKLDTLLGGKGANQALAACNVTKNVELVGNVGNDVYGDVLVQKLKKLRTHRVCSLQEASTGLALILSVENGDNSIVIVGGANQVWRKSVIVKDCKVVMLQCEIPESVNIQVAEDAKQLGIPVVLDLGGEDRPLSDALAKNVTYLCPNETELGRLTEMKVGDYQEMVRAAIALIKSKRVQHVVVTMGALGSFVVDNKENVMFQNAYNVSKVVDTTGAGDCFRGVFAANIALGNTIQYAMKMAAAASALCIQQRGAAPSMPSVDQIQDFMENAE